MPTHYIALIALSRGDSSSDEAEYLHYEWGLIREGYRAQLIHQRRILAACPPHCLCPHLHALGLLKPGGAYPTMDRVHGGSGFAHGRSARVKADLEQAADSLPLRWFATRKIFAIQQRSLSLFARRAAQVTPSESEPWNAYDTAIKRMAESLGWHAVNHDG